MAHRKAGKMGGRSKYSTLITSNNSNNSNKNNNGLLYSFLSMPPSSSLPVCVCLFRPVVRPLLPAERAGYHGDHRMKAERERKKKAPLLISMATDWLSKSTQEVLICYVSARLLVAFVSFILPSVFPFRLHRVGRFADSRKEWLVEMGRLVIGWDKGTVVVFWTGLVRLLWLIQGKKKTFELGDGPTQRTRSSYYY